MRYSVVFCTRNRYYEWNRKYWSFRKAKFYITHLGSSIMDFSGAFVFDNVKNTTRFYVDYEWIDEIP